MKPLRIGTPIHVVLGSSFNEHEGEHRGARVAEVVDAEQRIICAHVDLFPGDLGIELNAKEMKEQRKLIAEIKDQAQPPYFYCGLNAYMYNLPYSEEHTPGTWHWSEEHQKEEGPQLTYEENDSPGLLLSMEEQRKWYRKIVHEFPYLRDNFAAWTGNPDRSEDVQLAALNVPGSAQKKWETLLYLHAPWHIQRTYGPEDAPTTIGGETITITFETAISDASAVFAALFAQRKPKRYRFDQEQGKHVIEVEATERERRSHEIEHHNAPFTETEDMETVLQHYSEEKAQIILGATLFQQIKEQHAKNKKVSDVLHDGDQK